MVTRDVHGSYLLCSIVIVISSFGSRLIASSGHSVKIMLLPHINTCKAKVIPDRGVCKNVRL